MRGGEEAGFVGTSGLYRTATGAPGMTVQTCGQELAEIRVTEGPATEEADTSEERMIARIIPTKPMSGLIDIDLGSIDPLLFDVEGDPLSPAPEGTTVVFDPYLDNGQSTIPHASATVEDIAALEHGEYITRPGVSGDAYPANEEGRAYFENYCER